MTQSAVKSARYSLPTYAGRDSSPCACAVVEHRRCFRGAFSAGSRIARHGQPGRGLHRLRKGFEVRPARDEGLCALAWAIRGLCEYTQYNYPSPLKSFTNFEQFHFGGSPGFSRSSRPHYALVLTKPLRSYTAHAQNLNLKDPYHSLKSNCCRTANRSTKDRCRCRTRCTGHRVPYLMTIPHPAFQPVCMRPGDGETA